MTGPARSPLRWEAGGAGYWTAVGPTGTHWEIRDFQSAGAARYGIAVEHWDHPDWWADTLQAAKDLAAEIDARPPVAEAEQAIDLPLAPEGLVEVPFKTRAAPPDEPCPCGSTDEPIAVRPAPGTSAWWDDPSPYWKCPACAAYREEIDAHA